jgi:hypothetical protein
MFGERSSVVFVFDIAIGRFFLLDGLLALIAGTCRGHGDAFTVMLLNHRGSVAACSTPDLQDLLIAYSRISHAACSENDHLIVTFGQCVLYKLLYFVYPTVPIP